MSIWHRIRARLFGPPERGPSEATRARLQAEQDLAAARARKPEVDRLGASFREMRERNHFGDAIEAAMRRR